MLQQMFRLPIGDKCLVVKTPPPILADNRLWLDISSSSKVHIFQLCGMVRSLGFSCWLESAHVKMAGWSTVNHFFRIVQPHNLIHIKRLAKFNRGRG